MNLLAGGNDSLGKEQMILPREMQTSYNEAQEPLAPSGQWAWVVDGSWMPILGVLGRT